MNRERLQEVRNNADWRNVFNALKLEKDEKRSKPDDWWALSPFTKEKTSSFHMNEKGFYDFSAEISGGIIELVQRVLPLIWEKEEKENNDNDSKKIQKKVDCYEAGRWLVEKGVSYLNDSKKEKIKENRKEEVILRSEEKKIDEKKRKLRKMKKMRLKEVIR